MTSSEANVQGFVAEPGHGGGGVCQARLDEERIVGAFVERYVHAVVGDGHGRRDVQQVLEDLLGLGRGVDAADLLGQQPIQGAGHEGDLQIEVDLEADHAGQGSEMKERHGGAAAVFDEPALGVAGDQGRAAELEVVGPDGCRA